jgi:3-dehydroquinate synthase
MIDKHIFVYGPPAVGKSSVAAVLATHLNRPLLDLDEIIEKETGCSVADIFSNSGENAFRVLEQSALASAVSGSPSVIALGGGALLHPESRILAEKNGVVVVLMADLSTLETRIGTKATGRPLIDREPKNQLRKLYQNRKDHYESFTNQVAVGDVSVEDLIWRIQAAIGYFHISGMGIGYDVIIGSDMISSLATLLEAKQLSHPYYCVMDHHLAQIYQKKLQNSLYLTKEQFKRFVFTAGETSKTIDTIKELWNAMVEDGMDRGSTCLAFGGGVTGDLTGFAAATFMRGIAWVNVPTSLLAMVDSSLGGKTGTDLPSGKNLIGAFHPPSFVLVDTDLLQTLPDREWRNGMAEVIKHGVIGDPKLFHHCYQGLAVRNHLDWLIPTAVAVKARIITQDPYESGIRAGLNFGHTIGHAIEVGMEYSLTHGEAVSIGMVFEAWLAEKIGLASSGLSQEIADVLANFDLPIHMPPQLDVGTLMRFLHYDKKKKQGQNYFALPVSIGKVKVGVRVENLELLIKERISY